MKMSIFFPATLLLPGFIVLIMQMGCSGDPTNKQPAIQENITSNESNMDKKQLRHVVLFKFKESATPEDIKKAEDAFSALPGKITEIRDYEWGINNSPERLNKGFTHCFLLTFSSEEDRKVYLPHPDHKAFGALIGPYLEDVLVVDYWN